MQPIDLERIANLCGSNNENIRHLAKRLNVTIDHKGHIFQITGENEQLQRAEKLILKLYKESDNYLSKEHIHLNLQQTSLEELDKEENGEEAEDPRQDHSEQNGGDDENQLLTPRQNIKPKGENQRNYLKALEENNVQFAVGPAGTGKTFLAVAYAVATLSQKKVDRICLTRPVVEAGETLGFLPGSLIEKINPYLIPLYDSLFAMLGVEQTNDMIKNKTIEVSPLAYMRGRTLNNCIAILDEGQNTSREQMKMFLTRLGYNSTAIITGDLSQIDLPQSRASGMIHAIEVLKDVSGVGVSRLTTKDIARHPVVAKIINAYDKAENNSDNR